MLEVKVSGSKVLLARKRRLMTQTQLAKLTALPQTFISRVENSIAHEITVSQLEILSEQLGFPNSWFVPDGEDMWRKPLSVHSAAFRKAASPSMKKIDFVMALANHYVLQIRKFLEAVDLEVQLRLPAFEIVSESKGGIAEDASAVGSPEEAASRVRQAWQLPAGPIENLTALVEASGVIIVHASFKDVDVDGLTINPIGLKPVIFINADRPACRQRFSLAHELGHVVLHAYHTPDMEKEANRFAAELLMPEADIKRDLARSLSIPRLGQLKVKWRASMSSILYRASELRMIAPHQTKNFWIQMSKAGYRKREPHDFDVPLERPKILKQLIALHIEELSYSHSSLAQLVDTKLPEFLEMYDLVRETALRQKATKLRIVVDNEST